MPPHDLEATVARHVPGDGKAEIERIVGGAANEIYRVRRAGRTFALRTVAADSRRLGVDREWEARVLEQAAAAHLAPAVVYSEPRSGLLISSWVEGRTWSARELRQTANILRMAALMRFIHALPLPAQPRVMSPANWIADYSRAGARGSDALRDAAAAQLAALEGLPAARPVLCHSDLHALNVIDCGHALVALDWEYAHVSDPLWDLAGWGANNGLEPEARRELLAGYLGRTPSDSEAERLQRLTWLYDYVCSLWRELQ
jgi:thiamine kinase